MLISGTLLASSTRVVSAKDVEPKSLLMLLLYSLLMLA